MVLSNQYLKRFSTDIHTIVKRFPSTMHVHVYYIWYDNLVLVFPLRTSVIDGTC